MKSVTCKIKYPHQMLIIKVGAEMDLSILEEELFFHDGVCENKQMCRITAAAA